MATTAPQSVKGRLRNIYEGMHLWVGNALEDANYVGYYVSMDYKYNVMNTKYNPLITIRITPTVFEDISYGRVWQGATESKALQSNFLFSLHVFSKYSHSIGEDHNREAWVATRIIVDYLNTLDRSTYKSPRGVFAVDNIKMRESDPFIRNMGRIIIEGEINVIREDSP